IATLSRLRSPSDRPSSFISSSPSNDRTSKSMSLSRKAVTCLPRPFSTSQDAMSVMPLVPTQTLLKQDHATQRLEHRQPLRVRPASPQLGYPKITAGGSFVQTRPNSFDLPCPA